MPVIHACLFVCLGFIVFTHMETSRLPVKGCKSNSEGSLACHTYCDMGHPFTMVISKDPWHSHLLQSVYQWSCHYLYLRLRSVATGIQTPNLALEGPALTHCAVCYSFKLVLALCSMRWKENPVQSLINSQGYKMLLTNWATENIFWVSSDKIYFLKFIVIFYKYLVLHIIEVSHTS